MTGKEIVSKAVMEKPNEWSAAMNMDTMQRSIDTAIQAEREECAKIAEEHVCGCGDYATEVARRIRARRTP